MALVQLKNWLAFIWDCMGKDHKKSVVDQNGKLHGSGLYVLMQVFL